MIWMWLLPTKTPVKISWSMWRYWLLGSLRGVNVFFTRWVSCWENGEQAIIRWVTCIVSSLSLAQTCSPLSHILLPCDANCYHSMRPLQMRPPDCELPCLQNCNLNKPVSLEVIIIVSQVYSKSFRTFKNHFHSL